MCSEARSGPKRVFRHLARSGRTPVSNPGDGRSVELIEEHQSEHDGERDSGQEGETVAAQPPHQERHSQHDGHFHASGRGGAERKQHAHDGVRLYGAVGKGPQSEEEVEHVECIAGHKQREHVAVVITQADQNPFLKPGRPRSRPAPVEAGAAFV